MMTATPNKIAKLATVREVPAIIERGMLVSDNEPNYHKANSTVKYAKISDTVIVDGVDTPITIVVRKSLQKNKFWVHKLTLEKSTDSLAAGTKGSKTAYRTVDANDIVSDIQNKSNRKSEKRSERNADFPDMDEAAKAAQKTVFGNETVSEKSTDHGDKNQLRNSEKIGQAAIERNKSLKNVDPSVLLAGVEVMGEMADIMLPYLEEEGILPPDNPDKTIFKNGSYSRTERFWGLRHLMLLML